MVLMRVALCFSGLPKNVEYGFRSTRDNIIRPLKPDVFTFLWGGDAINADTKHDFLAGAQYVEKMYHPITHIVQEQTNLPRQFINKHDVPRSRQRTIMRSRRRNCLFMFKAIYEANKLKTQYEEEQGFKYDIVIRFRPDVRVQQQLGFCGEDEDTVYTYSDRDLSYMGGCGDMLAYGTSKVMDIYSDVYNHFYELQEPLWDKINDKGKSLFWNPHVILKTHLTNNNLTIAEHVIKLVRPKH